MEPKKWMSEKEIILKSKHLGPMVEDAFYQEKMMILKLTDKEKFDYMVSKMNYCKRKEYSSGKALDLNVNKGDLAYIDFGQAYQHEIGYLHFGLVMTVKRGKAFVVPLSGKYKAYLEAYDNKGNPTGKRHLMRLGYIEGLTKVSVLFINDSKWINTSRIIEIKAHIDVNGEIFKEVQKRIIEMIIE